MRDDVVLVLRTNAQDARDSFWSHAQSAEYPHNKQMVLLVRERSALSWSCTYFQYHVLFMLTPHAHTSTNTQCLVGSYSPLAARPLWSRPRPMSHVHIRAITFLISLHAPFDTEYRRCRDASSWRAHCFKIRAKLPTFAYTGSWQGSPDRFVDTHERVPKTKSSCPPFFSSSLHSLAWPGTVMEACGNFTSEVQPR